METMTCANCGADMVYKAEPHRWDCEECGLKTGAIKIPDKTLKSQPVIMMIDPRTGEEITSIQYYSQWDDIQEWQINELKNTTTN